MGSAPVARVCRACHTPLPDDAHPNRRYCTDKCKGRDKKARLYGLAGQQERLKLESDTGGACPICLRRMKKPQLDHDHKTGELMGIVCTTCNVHLLAWTFHDPDVARRLVDFLENPPARRVLGGPRLVSNEVMRRPSKLHRMWTHKR